jgi:hypothetical protein
MDVAGWAAGLPFGVASALRGTKIFHPAGVVHEATVTIAGDGPAGFLGERGEHRAIVRFSRAIGLPQQLPDILGMAIRLPDVHGPGRHQDLLLVTSSDAPVLHHALVPAGGFRERPYSTVLPYKAGGERFLIGARPAGEDRFELAVAPLLGRFRAIGEVRVGARLPDELDAIEMNPFNCGGGLEPAGFLNRLRDYAYPLSQAGRRLRQAVPPASPSRVATSGPGSGVAF